MRPYVRMANPPNPDAPDRELLARFLAGECSPEESARILAWAQSRPTWDSKAIWERISPAVKADNAGAAEPLRVVRHSPPGIQKVAEHSDRWRIPAMAVAASLLLVAGIGIYSRVATKTKVASVAPTREYHTDRGQRGAFKLPDGSAVQLGPQSSLRVESGYQTPARVVTLEGDAYFHVTHDTRHPFVVRTSRGDIRDLGTRFVVRARPNDDEMQVAVAEGSVGIGPDSVKIGAGELARIDASGSITPVRVKSIDDYFAWTEGRLVFDRAPLAEVLAELSRWFDTQFVLADPSLAKMRLTTVLRGETLSEALLVLRTSLNVDTRVEPGKVTLMRSSR
jgi:transmembrane sensor